MANFNTHLNVAFMVSGTLSLTVYKAGLIDDSGFLVCVALGTIGGCCLIWILITQHRLNLGLISPHLFLPLVWSCIGAVS